MDRSCPDKMVIWTISLDIMVNQVHGDLLWEVLVGSDQEQKDRISLMRDHHVKLGAEPDLRHWKTVIRTPSHLWMLLP